VILKSIAKDVIVTILTNKSKQGYLAISKQLCKYELATKNSWLGVFR